MDVFNESVIKRLTEKFKEGSSAIELDKQIRDGRGASLKGEESVSKVLTEICEADEWFSKRGAELYNPNTTNNREWFDFAIQSTPGTEKKIFIPVNIKITSLSSADNLSCKLGLYYALTGKLPADLNISQSSGWDSYFKSLSENMQENDRDYFFLVIPKKTDDGSVLNRKGAFYTSLKTLNSLVANGNNLPFQCKWDENKTRTMRSYEEAKFFLLKSFQESVDKQTTKELFHKYLDKFIVEA